MTSQMLQWQLQKIRWRVKFEGGLNSREYGSCSGCSFQQLLLFKKGSHHSPYLFFLHWVLKCSFQKIQPSTYRFPSGQCHSTTTYGFKNQWNWKFEMQLHYSSHHPPISSSDMTLSFICRTTCTICLRVAARFMQCGKDYPPCLHALFCLHTHDVLTNLVNCIFCRRPQKWWAARKELVASEQVKKKVTAFGL